MGRPARYSAVYSHSIISWHRNLLKQKKFQESATHNTVRDTVKAFRVAGDEEKRLQLPRSGPL